MRFDTVFKNFLTRGAILSAKLNIRRSVYAQILAILVAGTAGAAALTAAALAVFRAPVGASPICGIEPQRLGAFVDIPGGGFVSGADAVFPEEGPPERVLISPFRLQIHEVTNGQFAEFVLETGYVTEAERLGGSAQFVQSDTPDVFMSWWRLDAEATWRTPEGAGSDLEGLDLHPVVHVTRNDARAYAQWAGGRLPTELEWEYAASLGLFDPDDPESGVRGPDGEPRANIWTGVFPLFNSGLDGFSGTAPVGCFPPGLTGAYDLIGNVWEWTDSQFTPSDPRATIKGGSYLCSDNYCRRYRVPAREAFETDFSTAHIGFRIVMDAR